MQLFLFLNDLAGRWPLLDGAARFFYVGALPALGTLLLAQLLLFPRPEAGMSRSKLALAVVLALGLSSLLVWGFDLVAGWLHLGNLSPRPWMTRRVNWLVVEPQDDSFPCVEVALAAAVACASLRLHLRWGILSCALVALLSLTRMFCGNNYFADVLVGAALGASSFVLCWHLCQRHMALGRRAREFSLCASPLAVTLAGCYLFGLLSPRFQGKLGIERPAVAASASPVTVGAASAAASVTQGEGEGMAPDEGKAEELALAKRSALFLPQLEAFLRGKLTPLARPFRLLDVEAAPVKAGTTSYRCAAIRFEVPAEQANTRRLVADRAARLVRTAFALDSRLQNVDIIAVARDEGRGLDNSLMNFAGDEVPVFTASIQRKNLIVANPALAWLNAPGVDGGSWLRARSRIYINARALPDSPQSTRAPSVATVGTPWPGATSSATLAPSTTPAPSLTPTLTPLPTSSKTPRQSDPTPTPRPVAPVTVAPARPHPTAIRTVQEPTPPPHATGGTERKMGSNAAGKAGATSVTPSGQATPRTGGGTGTPTPAPTGTPVPRPTPKRTGEGAIRP